ncbi:MAG: hypothetical protein OHK0015_22010 [Chloroflexi bacterium OHK40]
MSSPTSEAAVKANSSEAQRLCLRGVAAARAGQKRLAAGLLTRSVQLDPRQEQAWLWLSGVLDDPEQQAFCLNAVLKLNPQSQPAQRGLQLLEERRRLNGAARSASGHALPEVAAVPAEETRQEPWWVGWRRSRREMSRARLLLWAFPLVLVCLALVLYESFALAVGRVQAPVAAPPEVAYSAPPPPVPTRPAFEPILEAEPLAVVESLTVGYLSALEPVRVELREATAAYRQVTSQPGGASVGHVAATQRLRSTVESAISTLGELRPPRTLQQAHNDYRRGLELEREGLDALLEFYGSYEVANANRAAQRFQEARAYIERAQAAFAGQARQLAELSAMGPQTAR